MFVAISIWRSNNVKVINAYYVKKVQSLLAKTLNFYTDSPLTFIKDRGKNDSKLSGKRINKKYYLKLMKKKNSNYQFFFSFFSKTHPQQRGRNKVLIQKHINSTQSHDHF